ncbi:archaeal heat shock protein Hsp20 [Staphylothermus hellenicus]|uniref:Heat shock protein Hsp20 n=1 Tax=Staphylothermus hellenicus (strain DSM 12710 / JCM 10830 / BK20S6-10-b1 / P8) TaxID=591019 RepID=D7DBC9_STAHD|nr:archaeal heat shock protein Hsp20 [Staphylothermus hellenicus]ADI31476.1 heat shock protein Hsp20 [Staphylothermus hellenicus DSM 12710]
MSRWDDYNKRRRRGFFDVFDEIFRQMEEEMNRLLREFETMEPREFIEEAGPTRRFGPYVYGFRITIGPDGKPMIEEFGNVKKVEGKRMISEEREPLVDVFEQDDSITVIAELPGVEKDKIKLEVSDDRRKLIISASDTNRKYYKEVELPAEVDPGSAKATYKNGVLEVTLKKIKRSEKKKGYEVKIE